MKIYEMHFLVADAAVPSADELARLDLTAQNSMATAAWLMLAVAIFQLAFSAIGLYVLWVTLRETRRAVQDSEVSTNIAMKSTEIASQGLLISKTIADDEARPWISISCSITQGFDAQKTHLGVDGYYLRLEGLARNHGHSPALNLLFNAEIGLMGDGRSEEQIVTDYCNTLPEDVTFSSDALFPGDLKILTHMLFLSRMQVDDAVKRMTRKLETNHSRRYTQWSMGGYLTNPREPTGCSKPALRCISAL